MGFLLVANASMTRPIRTLSEGRGFETSAHNLVCFGGAGGQHATSVARDLGIKRVLIHRLSSILSAYGMALADVVSEVQEPESTIYNNRNIERIERRFGTLREKGKKSLTSQGFDVTQIVHQDFLNMRYQGSDTTLMIPRPDDDDFTAAFVTRHLREFGFVQPRDLLVDDIRVRSVGKGIDLHVSNPFEELELLSTACKPLKKATAFKTRKVYFDKHDWVDSNVYYLKDMPKGSKVIGPGMIIDQTQTIVLDPSSEATVLQDHVVVDLLDTEKKEIGTDHVDPIQLSVFSHRFMSVAEQVRQSLYCFIEAILIPFCSIP